MLLLMGDMYDSNESFTGAQFRQSPHCLHTKRTVVDEGIHRNTGARKHSSFIFIFIEYVEGVII